MTHAIPAVVALCGHHAAVGVLNHKGNTMSKDNTTREPAVFRALKQLANEISSLQAEIAGLEARLGPVLRPRETQPEETPAENKRGCEVVARVEDEQREIKDCLFQISMLVERLEI